MENISKIRQTLLTKNIESLFSCNICRFSGHHLGRSGHGEMNLARVIINIVAVFVLCHIPRQVLVKDIKAVFGQNRQSTVWPGLAGLNAVL